MEVCVYVYVCVLCVYVCMCVFVCPSVITHMNPSPPHLSTMHRSTTCSKLMTNVSSEMLVISLEHVVNLCMVTEMRRGGIRMHCIVCTALCPDQGAVASATLGSPGPWWTIFYYIKHFKYLMKQFSQKNPRTKSY